MKLNKPVKTIVGLATLMYAIYPVLFFAVWLFMVFGIIMTVATSSSSSNEMPVFFFIPFMLMVPLQFCFLFLYVGLNVFYLIHVIKATDANETVRIILAIGNFFFPFLSMPIYYYLYIWSTNPPEWAMASHPNPDASLE